MGKCLSGKVFLFIILAPMFHLKTWAEQGPKAPLKESCAGLLNDSASTPPVMEAAARARNYVEAAKQGLIERDGIVDLVFTAVLAKEHVLLLGPPRCGQNHEC